MAVHTSTFCGGSPDIASDHSRSAAFQFCAVEGCGAILCSELRDHIDGFAWSHEAVGDDVTVVKADLSVCSAGHSLTSSARSFLPLVRVPLTSTVLPLRARPNWTRGAQIQGGYRGKMASLAALLRMLCVLADRPSLFQ